MNRSTVGLVTGMTLGFAGYFGGFGAFVVVAVLGAIGLIIGCFLQGDVTIGDFVHHRAEDNRPQDEKRQIADGPGRQEFRHSQRDAKPPRSRVT